MNESFCIELRITSHPDYLCVARAAVGTAVRKIGFESAEADKVEIALDEALSNVIRHGYDGDTTRPIWVRFRHVSSKPRPAFEVVIEDLARQVDPATIKGRDLDEVKPGGLGVNIIQAVMDSVEYSPRPEGGMRLTMTKRAQAAQPAASTP